MGTQIQAGERSIRRITIFVGVAYSCNVEIVQCREAFYPRLVDAQILVLRGGQNVIGLAS